MRSLSVRCLRTLAAAAALVGLASESDAQTRSWTNTSGGSFNLSSNWNPASVPGVADSAVFGLSSTYTVSFPSSVTNTAAQVTRGNVQWDLGTSSTPRTYTVGTLQVGGTNSATLSFRNGTLSTQTVRVHDNDVLSVGLTSGFNHPAGTLTVNGQLRIESGGQLEVRSNTAAGAKNTLNARGDVLVDGGFLRSLGSGTINLSTGRTLTVTNGGRFFQNGGFHAGGGKTLRGAGGASISFNQLDVAASGSTGTAIFEGSGTRLTANFPSFSTNESHVWGAAGGTATVDVRSGATASFRGGLLLAADGSNASATLTVDGPGTHFEQTNVGSGGALDQVVIGHATAGSAAIHVRNGALFTAEAGGSGNSRVVVNATGQLNVQSGGTFSAHLIQRNGGQINLAGGALRFNSYSGNLVHAGGTLVPGHVLNDGNSAFIDGNYTQQSAAALKMEIGGIAPGQWSQLGVSGNAILGGTLDLTLVDDFVPVLGNSFLVLQTGFGNIGGRFDRVEGALPSAGVGFAVTYTPREVIVRTALPGDANLDNAVTLQDFNILAGNFGQTGRTWQQGDFNGDGLVSLLDFNRLAAHFGVSAAGPQVTPEDWSALASAVPEPAGAAVGGLLGMSLAGRRRRSRPA